jgi:hypothetical protein
VEHETLRSLISWHAEYRPEWDGSPEEYAAHEVVQWGRSRRLGLFKLGVVKAYLGVQHVDPGKPGWDIVGAPQTRFFLSVFISGRCIILRTFPTIHAALDALAVYLQGKHQS